MSVRTAGHTFVLVHGAWHDGTSWNQVAAYLRQQRHQVHTPTLAGHGDGRLSVTTQDAADHVAGLLDTFDLQDVILVGHCMGGIVASLVAQRIPDRIARVVFHSAFVVESGHSLLDEVPPAARDQFDKLRDTDGRVLVPYRMYRDTFIGDGTDELARRIYSRLHPVPWSMFDTPVNLDVFYRMVTNGRLPTSYLLAEDDVVLPPGEWRGTPASPPAYPARALHPCRAPTRSCTPRRTCWHRS